MNRPLLSLIFLLSGVIGAAARAAAPDWSAPAPLPAQAPDPSSSALVAEPGGHSAFAAAASRGRVATLRVTLRDPNGGFSAPLRVPAALASADRAFGIAVDGAGRALVAFTGRRGGRSAVMVAGCGPRRCGRVQRVGTPDRLGGEPQLAFDPRRKRAIVLWRGVGRGGHARLLWRLMTRGRLGAVHALGEDGHDARLAADGAGGFVAVWRRAGRRTAIRGTIMRGSGFARVKTLSAGGGPASAPALAVAPDGRALAVWRQSSPDAPGVLRAGAVAGAERQPGGRGFGAPFAIAPAAHAGAVAAAVGATGRAVVAWSDFGGVPSENSKTQIVMGALREPGQAFGPPAVLSRAAGIYIVPAAAVDDAGTAAVAWSEPPSALAGAKMPSRLVARLASAGAGFAPEETLDQAPADCAGIACDFPAAPHLVAFARTIEAAWTTVGGASAAVHVTP